MARNADLQECVDDRLLTKNMAGLSDQETHEELLARVPNPKLEEAKSFVWSKEAARRSNMDLHGPVVQRSVAVILFHQGKSPREVPGENTR